MDAKKIQRINELARKSKQEGLTPSEKEEQRMLIHCFCPYESEVRAR